jgi:hypothetical protein
VRIKLQFVNSVLARKGFRGSLREEGEGSWGAFRDRQSSGGYWGTRVKDLNPKSPKNRPALQLLRKNAG